MGSRVLVRETPTTVLTLLILQPLVAVLSLPVLVSI